MPFTSKSRTIVVQSLSFIVSHNTFFLKRRGKMNLFKIESATATVKKIHLPSTAMPARDGTLTK